MSFNRAILGLALVACGAVAVARAADGPPTLGDLNAEEQAAGRDIVKHVEGPLAEDGKHAAGHGPTGHQVNQNPMEWQTDLAVWTAVVFLIVFGLLWKFAWGPIAAGLDKREQGIADDIAQADAANVKAQQLLADYKEQLTGAKQEIREMLEKARHDAELVGQQIVEKAKTDAQSEQKKMLAQIDAATDSALQELADRSAQLAVDLAGKIVQSRLRPEDHARLIEQAVSNFDRPSSN